MKAILLAWSSAAIRFGRAVTLGFILAAPSLTASAKGEGRSFVLAGQVANVKSDAAGHVLLVSGDLLVTECSGRECSTSSWAEGKTILLHVRRQTTFFAMTPDRHAGAIRTAATLADVLKRAAMPGRVTRIELVEPRISFATSGDVRAIDARILRITDHALR
jgi:hypothetical protein